MNEIDILDIFYDELRARGVDRTTLFISIDDTVVAKLSEKLGGNVQLADVQHLVDICIANEWIERTTADPHYKYLSLTNDGLEIAIAQQYKSSKR